MADRGFINRIFWPFGGWKRNGQREIFENSDNQFQYSVSMNNACATSGEVDGVRLFFPYT